MTSRKDPYRKYAKRFLLALAVFFAIASAVNALVDPWRVLRTPLALASLEPYRDFSDAHRTGKAGLAMDPAGCDMVYIGSSRLEMGLPTEHPAFGKQRVVNLALAGGLIPENTAMARFAMRRNPGLRTIILGVDTGDLTSTIDLTGQTDFGRSPLAEGQSPTERTLRYLTGVRALGESVKVLVNRAKGKESKYTPGGQRVGGLGSLPNVRDHVAERATTFCARAQAFRTDADRHVNARKERKLRDFLSEARRAGVRVVVLLPPRHSLMQIHPTEDAPDIAPWLVERRLLAGICQDVNRQEASGPPVELLDFCTFNHITDLPLPAIGAADQRFPTWPDLEHFSTATGMELLDRIISRKPGDDPDWGVDVLATGIDAHLARLKAEHAGYCKEHAGDVAWFRRILASVPGGE